jgi:uncharacterized protein YegJ (DUF2314 family)
MSSNVRIAIIIIAIVVGLIKGFASPRKPAAQNQPPTRTATVAKPPMYERNSTPFPAGDLYGKQGEFEFSIYFMPRPLKDPEETFKSLCKKQFSQFTVLDKAFHAQTKLPAVFVRKVDVKKYSPPSLDSLVFNGRGMSDQQKNDLQKCEQVFALNFRDDRPTLLKSMKSAHELMLAMVNETGGILWDEDTRECFTPAAWKERRLARWTTDEIPEIPFHLAFHVYAEGELYRIVSLGMRKFALPDICIENVARSSQGSFGGLANLVCQTMGEKGTLSKPGVLDLDVDSLKNNSLRESMIKSYSDKATGKGQIQLVIAALREGDADNRLAELRFPGAANVGIQERGQQFISQLFGASDSISYIKHDDALLAASEKAKQELARLAPIFQKKIPDLEHLMVKAPFRTDSGGNEWMWVEVTLWQGTNIEGILMNDPFEIKKLKAGARVKVDQQSVFDYIHRRADGTEVGNETGNLISKQNK